MGIFSAIIDKIFHHPAAQPAAVDTPAPAVAVAAADPAPEQAITPPAPSEPVDVEAVLTQMASDKGFDGNWQESIVDLLKLLDLDSSLSARKDLANELDVHVADDGTAEENIALHHAVMQKLADNGGKVPDSLKGT